MTETSASKDITRTGEETTLQVSGSQEKAGASRHDAVYVDRNEKVYRAAVLTARGALQFVIMAVVLVGAAFLMNQLEASREVRPARVPSEAVYTIEAVVAKAAENRPEITVFGDIVAGRTLNLTALVSGEVIEVNPDLRVGARLEKGDVLLRINPFSYEIARDEARANLKEAEAALSETEARLGMEETGLKRTREQLDIAEADLARARSLVRANTLTVREVEERELIASQRRASFQTSGGNIAIQKAQIDARQATIERLRVGLRNAERELQNTTLMAPFDAVVQAVNVEIGQTVATNLSLLTLYQADTLDARFVLSDGQYGRLIDGEKSLIGKEVTVSWSVGSAKNSYKARIDRIGAEIASNRGGISVFARIDEDTLAGALRPGAFVSVTVPDRSFPDTFRLPETAIFEGPVVYVVNDESRLDVRPVDIAAFDGGDAIIRSGLAEGDMVLITQIAEVGPGLLVRRVDDGDKAAKAAPSDVTEQSADLVKTRPRG